MIRGVGEVAFVARIRSLAEKFKHRKDHDQNSRLKSSMSDSIRRATAAATKRTWG